MTKDVAVLLRLCPLGVEVRCALSSSNSNVSGRGLRPTIISENESTAYHQDHLREIFDSSENA